MPATFESFNRKPQTKHEIQVEHYGANESTAPEAPARRFPSNPNIRGNKEFCTHYILRGSCAYYNQQGCLYSHDREAYYQRYPEEPKPTWYKAKQNQMAQGGMSAGGSGGGNTLNDSIYATKSTSFSNMSDGRANTTRPATTPKRGPVPFNRASGSAENAKPGVSNYQNVINNRRQARAVNAAAAENMRDPEYLAAMKRVEENRKAKAAAAAAAAKLKEEGEDKEDGGVKLEENKGKERVKVVMRAAVEIKKEVKPVQGVVTPEKKGGNGDEESLIQWS